MNSQQVIDWKLEQLSKGSDTPMPKAMQNVVDASPELARELAFIEQFYHHPVPPEVQPGASMDKQFYAALSRAESAQVQKVEGSAAPDKQMSWWQSVWRGFLPHSMGQVAALGLVFVLGFMLNRQTPSEAPTEQASLAQLQSQVASLSNVVALSLLRDDAASARLSGIRYSQSGNVLDQTMVNQFIEMLANDDSISVKLAVIDALEEAQAVTGVEDALIEVLIATDHPLVQMELCRLLLRFGGADARDALASERLRIALHPDVAASIAQSPQSNML